MFKMFYFWNINPKTNIKNYLNLESCLKDFWQIGQQWFVTLPCLQFVYYSCLLHILSNSSWCSSSVQNVLLCLLFVSPPIMFSHKKLSQKVCKIYPGINLYIFYIYIARLKLQWWVARTRLWIQSGVLHFFLTGPGRMNIFCIFLGCLRLKHIQYIYINSQCLLASTYLNFSNKCRKPGKRTCLDLNKKNAQWNSLNILMLWGNCACSLHILCMWILNGLLKHILGFDSIHKAMTTHTIGSQIRCCNPVSKMRSHVGPDQTFSHHLNGSCAFIHPHTWVKRIFLFRKTQPLVSCNAW